MAPVALGATNRRVASNMRSDSLAGLELERIRAVSAIADIGTGAGFPGLVLAIAPVRVTLVVLNSTPSWGGGPLRCELVRAFEEGHVRSQLSVLSLARAPVLQRSPLC
jgi:hypothetical protein